MISLNIQIKLLVFSAGFVDFDAVVAVDFALEHVVELAANHLLADCRDVVDKDMALEVVAFVLDDACKIGVDVLVMLLPVLVEVVDVNLGVACDVLVYARHAQASFFACFGGACFVDSDFGVDEHQALVFELRELVAQSVDVDVDYSSTHAHLWRCDADAVTVVHRVLHILDKFVKTWIVFVDRFSYFA